jgi:hypothetical protein
MGGERIGGGETAVHFRPDRQPLRLPLLAAAAAQRHQALLRRL